MGEETDVVAEFIMDLLPKNLVETIQLLVSLGYPLPDKKSMVLRLEERKAEDPKGEKGYPALSRPIPQLIESVAGPFEPVDFGIDSPQSALEKFFARTRQDQPPESGRGPSLPDFGGPGEGEPFVPRTPTETDFAFGSDTCGRAAKQWWLAYLAEPRTRRFGPRLIEYDLVWGRLNRCRASALSGHPQGDLCKQSADDAYARCVINDGGSDRECRASADQAYDRCVRRWRRGGLGAPYPYPGF